MTHFGRYIRPPVGWLLGLWLLHGDGILVAQARLTPADAAQAYAAFNTHFYDTKAKLYYSTTKRDHVAAIWTQAIYWDLAMHVYERTKTPAQRQLITDIYEGNHNQYDGYNWTNHKVWFIYDDMMWWVMALARAHQLTSNRVYLQQAISGFDHVWAGSYDPVGGGMFWDFKHSGKNACVSQPWHRAVHQLSPGSRRNRQMVNNPNIINAIAYDA